MDFDAGSEIIDALLLLYLPKSKVSVIGSPDYVEESEPKGGETENIIALSDSVNVNNDEKAVPDIPEEIRNMEELDTALGLDNCGSEEGYLRALEIFAGNASVKADEIESFFKAGELEDYTIRVHALKSSARIIGASVLSENARLLEQAGKDKDRSYIDDNTPGLLDDFRSLGKKLNSVFSDDAGSDKELISADKLKDAYNTIYELAQMMDYDSLELVFDSLKEYSFEEKDRAGLERIKSAMDELNWDGVLKAAKESL